MGGVWAACEPDEVWWHWAPDWSPEGRREGRWRLKRRYVKLFKMDGTHARAGMAIFEWGPDGWTGTTTFRPDTIEYLDKIRLGRLIHQKKTAP